MNILVYCSNEEAKQNQLASAYNDNKDLIRLDEDKNEYDFIVEASYPNVYKRNGIQSVICYKCSLEVKDLIDSLPPVVQVLAIDDNNPDTEYQWESPSAESKFLSVVGNNFFTGETIEFDGETITIPPRKKLACLA